MVSGFDINRVARDDRVLGEIYTDPEIFELEMEKIFYRSWVYVAHESELPQPGDYKAAYIGLQPLIVSRGMDDGNIYVMFNRCRHRGAVVCQEAFGNSNYFRCPYHGWTYTNKGDLVGVPYRQAYGKDFSTSDLGLVHVPKVASYRGFIFASLSEDVPTLEEHLGRSRPYIDWVVDLSPEGIDLSVGAHRAIYKANWKLQMENTVDNYHFSFVHQSFVKIVEKRKGGKHDASGNPTWRSCDLGNGHGMLDFGEQHALGGANMPFNMNVFPNIGLVSAHLRVVRPLAVDRTEVTLYPILLKGVSDELNESRLREHEEFYGPAGFGAPDDIEVAFERVYAGIRAEGNPWVLFNRGVERENVDDKGIRYGHVTDEVGQRGFYRQWRRMMSDADERKE